MLLRSLFHYLLVLGWMALIYASSATPDLRAVPWIRRLGLLPDLLGPEALHLLELAVRKGAHVTVYAILGALLCSALASPAPQVPRRLRLPLAYVTAVLYAISDEFHQTFVPTRQGSLVDVGIDSVGALLGVLLFRALTARRNGARTSR